MLKGLLDTLVLDVLCRGDDYGFGILQKIGGYLEDGHGVFKEQTIYPLLHRLEANGYVESYHRPGNRGTPRKYYRITEPGRARLAERTSQWRQIADLLAKTILKPQTASG